MKISPSVRSATRPVIGATQVRCQTEPSTDRAARTSPSATSSPRFTAAYSKALLRDTRKALATSTISIQSGSGEIPATSSSSRISTGSKTHPPGPEHSPTRGYCFPDYGETPPSATQDDRPLTRNRPHALGSRPIHASRVPTAACVVGALDCPPVVPMASRGHR